MASATATFSEVQSHVLSVLSAKPTPVLLGHSLESDLKVLQICHPYVIDTAIIYHHPRGRPLKPGLAWLTKKWCGREIQNRGEGGHDPEEDARACLDLLKKKVDNGTTYMLNGFRFPLNDFQVLDLVNSRPTMNPSSSACLGLKLVQYGRQ